MEKSNATSNKELIRKFFENFEKGNRDEVEKLQAENFQLRLTGIPNPLTRSESKQKMKEYNNAFPDLKFNIEQQITEGDTVVTRAIGRATHKGEFNGIPATNKKVTATSISIHRIKNNKIVEETTEFDALGLMQQLGAFSQTTKNIADKAVASVH